MFRTIACRAMVSLVAFSIGCAAFVLMRPTPAQNAIAPALKPLAHSQVTAITFRRQGCTDVERKCPVYDVTFRNDGTATYIGYANDDFIGTFTAEYPQRNFAFLVEQLEREDF